jgi:hypothetical protein
VDRVELAERDRPAIADLFYLTLVKFEKRRQS